MRSTPSSRISWLKAVNADRHITGTEFRVAFALADHVNNVTGFAFPAAERLAKQMHLSIKTVRRALSSLLRHGYVKVGPRMYKSVTYILTLNHRSLSTDVHMDDKRGAAPGQIENHVGDKGDHQTYYKPNNKTYDHGGEAGVSDGLDAAIEADVKMLCSPFLGRWDPLLCSPKRSRYEPELRERFGADADGILAILPEQCTEQLLQRARGGALTMKDLWLARRIASRISGKVI
jgi:DNA-binding MarR family transcriptional regulator